MNDNPLAALQPDAGGAPPAPVVPEAPAAPIVPDAPTDATPQPSAEEKADIDEWNSVTDSMFPGLKKPEEENKPDEPTKPDQKPTPPEAPKDGKTPEQLPDPNDKGTDKDGAGKKPDDGQVGEEDEPTAPTDAAARLTAREQQAQVEAVKTDVRQKMFKNFATELRAKPEREGELGELLDSPEKMTEYINPSTGQPFTKDEAILWMAQAQRQLDKNVTEMNRQVEQITDTNLDLKDQADVINYQYGALLQAMPELRASLWAQYEKTLSKDAQSGIITKAPVSLQQFYETALEPYAHLGRQLEAQEAAKVTPPTPPAAAPDAAKQQAEAQRQQRRQDRSDIYGPGKVDTATEDDKEWASAAQAVFGDQLKK